MDKPQLAKLFKKLQQYVLLLITLIGFGTYAQTFPIVVSTQIAQPSPIYLSNYADATTTNSPLKIQLVLNDLTISSRQVRLKIYFQGNGISFATNDFVTGAGPLYLEGGFPLQLTNVDLAPYFEYQNLSGLNQNQYAQPLPEGLYTISVEVYDYATGKKLSKKTASTTIIFQNEPPFLNLPSNNTSIMQQNIQNIVFSWTPRSINVSNVEYEFSLVEIWDKYTPVQNAFAYSPPLYTTTTRTTTLQYGLSEPPLIPGRKYAWRIKAKALLGAEEVGVFKNNGFSEIFSFTYEIFCTPPLAIETSGVSQDQAKVSWSGSLDNFDYQVNYRQKNTNSDWYHLVTPRENATISNLKPNTVYEYTVGSSCDAGKYVHSTVKEFTTLSQDEISFKGCGIQPDPKDLANQTPLPSLFPNDVVTAGDFPIVVLKATGSNGNFSGEGYVTLPFLEKFKELIDAADALGEEKVNIGQYSRIRITFNNIGVNTDFKLISGEIIAAYDPNWGSMADLDGIVNDLLGDNGNVVNHQVDFVIESVVKNDDGTITVKGPGDLEFKLDKTPNDIIITDKGGNQFTVPANAPAGNIETSGKVAPGGIPTSKNTNGMGSGGSVAQISSEDVQVVFKTSGFYSFDTAPEKENGSMHKTYETIPTKNGGSYAIPYKAVSDVSGHDIDFVSANVILKNGKTKEDLVFKTQFGTEIKPEWNGDEVKLPLKKTLDFAKENIIATVRPAKPKDTLQPPGKYDIAGTVNLWHLTSKKVNVTLVSINGASIPADAEKRLKEIYEPAGVSFEINTVNVELTNTWGSTIETGDSDLMNTYTDEQQAITQALLNELGTKYKNDTYYMLFTNEKASNNYDGFMPLKRQFGFVFDGTSRTLAHELGHGVFGLQHPSVKFNATIQTDLLMDYGKGTLLSHNDWEIIHAPGLQLYPFTQGSSDGALAGGYGLTPDFEFISAGESNVVVARNNLVNKGILSGFRDELGSIYLWNKDKNKYTLNGEKDGVVYIKEPKKNLKDDDVLWLIYNYSTDCNTTKYIHTTYGELIKDKDFLNNDKVKAQQALSNYIDKIDNVSQKENGLFYSGFVGCGDIGNENIDNCKKLSNADIDANITIVTKAINDQTKTFTELETILKKVISICVLEKLTFEVRSKILDKYYKVNDDSQWEISYGLASTKDHFFIRDVFLTTPKNQQDSLVQKIKDENYKWITKLYDYGKTIKGVGNDVDYYQVAEIFLTLGKWAMENYDSLKIQPTKKHFTFDPPTEYYPGQQPFLLGAGDYNVALDSGKETESRIIQTLVEVDKGRIGLYNKYNLIDLRTYISATGTESPKRDATIEYIEDFDPFETITVIAGTENSFGLEKGKEIVVPAIVALAYQGILKEKYAAENLRSLSNSVMIASGIVAAPFSGGSSVAAVVASISTGGIAIGIVDNYMQAKIKEGNLDSNSTLYKAWENVYIGYSLLDLGAGGVNLGLKSYQTLSTINFINNFKNFEAILNTATTIKPGATLNGFNEVKAAVTGGVVNTKLVNSIIEFNKFDRFINQFTNYVKKTTVSSAMLINVTFGGFDAISTTNKAGNLIEMTINSAKATGATAEVIAEFASKTANIADDLNNAATISIKTVPNAIAEEGKIAFVKLDENNFVIATQINSKIQFNYFKLTGATPHFYQSSPDSNDNDPSTKCPICPERPDNTSSSQLCLNLQRLEKNTNNLTAISKLCGIANLNTFVIKLLEFDTKNQSSFLNDINEVHAGNYKYISSNISKVDVDILKAWKLLQDARPELQYRKDWEVLKEAKAILNNSSSLTKLGEVEGIKTIIEKNYTAPCNVCSNNNTKLILLDDYLSYLDNFVTFYNDKKGASIVKGPSGILSGGINQVKATAFVLRVLKENSGYTSTISSFEEKIETINDAGEENKAFADIIENNNKIIECKSWEINGKAFQNFVKEEATLTGSVKQFATYLSDDDRVTSMDKIEYWFDKMKLGNNTDPTQVKEKFKQMMYNGTTLTKKGELIFEAIWGNSALRGDLFLGVSDKNEAKDKFEEKINDASKSFYDFINVK